MTSRSPRPELEVFVNDMGTISIRRERSSVGEESLVVVRPDELSSLIGALDRARSKSLYVDADDADEVTIPAIEYAPPPLSST
jgi:hypothetical protein